MVLWTLRNSRYIGLQGANRPSRGEPIITLGNVVGCRGDSWKLGRLCCVGTWDVDMAWCLALGYLEPQGSCCRGSTLPVAINEPTALQRNSPQWLECILSMHTCIGTTLHSPSSAFNSSTARAVVDSHDYSRNALGPCEFRLMHQQ